MVKNAKELVLFIFLHLWTQAYIHSLDSFIRGFVLTYVGMFLRISGGPACTGFDLCT